MPLIIAASIALFFEVFKLELRLLVGPGRLLVWLLRHRLMRLRTGLRLRGRGVSTASITAALGQRGLGRLTAFIRRGRWRVRRLHRFARCAVRLLRRRAMHPIRRGGLIWLCFAAGKAHGQTDSTGECQQGSWHEKLLMHRVAELASLHTPEATRGRRVRAMLTAGYDRGDEVVPPSKQADRPRQGLRGYFFNEKHGVSSGVYMQAEERIAQ